MKRKFLLSLCFFNKKLCQVDFTVVSDDLPSSWDDWSEKGELKRKQLNEEFLKEIFKTRKSKKLQGKPRFGCPEQKQDLNYDFIWGDVTSTYDERSGGSDVVIRYNEKGRAAK